MDDLIHIAQKHFKYILDNTMNTLQIRYTGTRIFTMFCCHQGYRTTFQNTSKFVSAARRIFNSLFHASKSAACDNNNAVTILSINCRTLYYKFPSNEANTALSDLADEQTLLSVLGVKHFRPFSSLSVMQNHLIGLTTTTKKRN